jgi:hypothetical protein
MPELKRFKTEINLTEYAASEGYEIDEKESSRNSVVMRHPSGDKVIVARGFDRHWIYFSVRNDRDNGPSSTLSAAARASPSGKSA